MPTPISGLLAILNRALANGTTFYVMLTSTVMDTNSGLDAAAAGEISGGGYVRQSITFGTASRTADGYAQTLASLAQFTASGGNIGPFNALVITDAATGNAGTVYGYYNYPTPQTILSGAALTVQYPYKMLTQ